MKPNKKVTLQLVGLDSNAFALMGAFRQQARQEGWTAAEIKYVIDECMKGDYDHLLCTLSEFTDAPEDDDDYDFDDKHQNNDLDDDDEEEDEEDEAL